MIKAAILGYGTIGSGVAKIFWDAKEQLKTRAGEEIELKYVLDLREFPGDPAEKVLVHDFDVILKDDEVKVVVETMGGTRPAYQFVKSALESGKSVCTSNKELVAAHGAELLKIAREKSVNFFFEASVGGGIPIIRPLNECLTVDYVEKISGILNGTTNYILTKMTEDGSDFASVLKEAQEKGYAEKNPEADVEGYDACRKIAILTSLAYGKQLDFDKIYTEGITKITDVDIRYAKAMGAKIKIFGTSLKQDGRVYAMVSPVMIKSENPLYNVNDVFNGIFVKGNYLGDVMFYGKGAGSLPTASAVAADVVAAVKSMGSTVPMLWSEEKLELADFNDLKNRFFVRLSGSAAENAAKVKEAFGEVEAVDAGVSGEYAFVTGKISEGTFKEKAEGFSNLVSRIRADF